MAKKEEKIELSPDRVYGHFKINSIGEPSGNSYIGSFKVVSILDPEQTLAAGRELRALLGANPAFASDREYNIASALAQLKQRVVEAPPFWNNGKVKDENILIEIFDKALEVEFMYRKESEDRAKNSLNKLKEHISGIEKRNKVKEENE